VIDNYVESFSVVAFFKVVVLGDGGIGKTSICNYLTTGEFFGSYKLSIGADFFSKKITVDGEEVTLQICDVGGQDQFQEISTVFTKGAHGAILCYDITRRETVDSLDRWMAKLDDPSIPKVLVSTKNDVEELREVFDEEGLEIARRYNIPYYIPTTSLKGIGITETFEAISRLMLMNKEGEPLPSEPSQIDVDRPIKPEVRTVKGSQFVSAQPIGLGRSESDSPSGVQAPLASGLEEEASQPSQQTPTAPPTPKTSLIQPPTTADSLSTDAKPEEPSEPTPSFIKPVSLKSTVSETEEVPETPSIGPPTISETTPQEEPAPPTMQEEQEEKPFQQPGIMPPTISETTPQEEPQPPTMQEEEKPFQQPQVEPPTEPERTSTQPISTITESEDVTPSFLRESEVTPSSQLEEEKVEEEEKEEKPKERRKSRFSFLDRLREERERYKKKKDEKIA
jgi:small GTP-binding protein